MSKPIAARFLLPLSLAVLVLTGPLSSGAAPAPTRQVGMFYEEIDARNTPMQRQMRRRMQPRRATIREHTHNMMNTLRYWFRPYN